MDVVGRATQEAKAEDEGRCYAAGPHPDPLDSGSQLRSTSSIPGVVPQGEGEKRHTLFGDRVSNMECHCEEPKATKQSQADCFAALVMTVTNFFTDY